MYTYKLIGSFKSNHLESWINENARRLHSQWKIAGHAIIKFHPSRAVPFVYKSIGNIHIDSIADLEKKFPNNFTLIVISETLSAYNKPTNTDVIYPFRDVYYTKDIPNFECFIDTDKLKFNIERAHWINDYTFTTENTFLDNSDRITETRDVVEVDFDNRKLISSIIDR
jgi:hypothetical protein